MTNKLTKTPVQPVLSDEMRLRRERCGPGEFVCVMLVQLLLLAVFAPGDGGRWLRYALPLVVVGNLVVYKALVRDASRRLKHAGHLVAVLAAVAVVTGILTSIGLAVFDVP